LIGASDVEVFPDDLLEEDPAGHGAVEHLRERELDLENGKAVADSGSAVVATEWMRQAPEPFAEENVDLLGAQLVADFLQHSRRLAGEDSIIERREGECRRRWSCRFTYSWPLMHSLAL